MVSTSSYRDLGVSCLWCRENGGWVSNSGNIRKFVDIAAGVLSQLLNNVDQVLEPTYANRLYSYNLTEQTNSVVCLSKK